MTKRTALVTGSTDGIGLTTAKNLASMGYNVLVHGRSPKRIDAACQTIRQFVEARKTKEDNGDVLIQPFQADLSILQECERLAQQVKDVCQEKNLELSILMNNAGVYEEDLSITPDGLERTMAVNVVAPFIITSHLLPQLMQATTTTPPPRIVTASSISQCYSIQDWDDVFYYKRKSFSAHGSYAESKLLDAMLAQEFSERLQKRQEETDSESTLITSNSLDPGTVNTKMLYAGWGPCGIDVDNALDETWLCTSPDVEGITGKYFVGRRLSRSDYPAKNRAKLWELLSDISPKAADMWSFDWLE